MLQRVPTIVVDAVLALVFVGVNTWEVLNPTADGVRAGGTVTNLVVLDLFAALLVLRRHRPLLCWSLMLGWFVLTEPVLRHSDFAWGSGLPALIVTYTVARYADRRWSRLALLSGPLLWLGVLLADPHSPKVVSASGFFVVSTVAAWGSGRLLRRLAERDAVLQQARDRLTTERDRREAAAVREERARIALEMHDVVAVAVESMVADLADERTALAAKGDDVHRLLAAEDAGRQALVELRRTVGALRPADQAPDRVPSLADAPALVERYREAGLDVAWRSDPTTLLPPGVSFAAYRILQEALTNALKHGAGRVEAGVLLDDGDLVLRVRNPLAPVPAGHPSGRHGLVGMRERVAAFGGSLQAGLADDAFEVRAVLPARTEVLA